MTQKFKTYPEFLENLFENASDNKILKLNHSLQLNTHLFYFTTLYSKCQRCKKKREDFISFYRKEKDNEKKLEYLDEIDFVAQQEYVYGIRLLILYLNVIRKHRNWVTIKHSCQHLQNAWNEVHAELEKLKDSWLKGCFTRIAQQNEDSVPSRMMMDKNEVTSNSILINNHENYSSSDQGKSFSANACTFSTNERILSTQNGNVRPNSLEVLPSPYQKDVERCDNVEMASLDEAHVRTKDIPLIKCDVYINRGLIDQFLNYSFLNLEKDLEFCGILAGRMEGLNYFITHCIIPDQVFTKDSCACVNEMDVFDYQHAHELQTLGWIHTHPTQGAFLSTVDLVTQFGYQILLPEAIAIVCAPKADPSLGIFRIKESAFPVIEKAISKDELIAKGEKHAILSHEPLFETCKHVICSYEVDIPMIVADLRKAKSTHTTK